VRLAPSGIAAAIAPPTTPAATVPGEPQPRCQPHGAADAVSTLIASVQAAKASAAVPATNFDLIVYLQSLNASLFRIRGGSSIQAAEAAANYGSCSALTRFTCVCEPGLGIDRQFTAPRPAETG
jgi:hypothetical protein